jgi:hypothetical protein
MKINYVENKVSYHGKWNNKNWYLFLLISFPMVYCGPPEKKETKFDIDIWNYNSSLSFTVQYHFDNEKMFVKRIGGLVHEDSDTLKTRQLTISEKELISCFLDSFPIESIKNKYEKPFFEDGDQKKIDLTINDKSKTIFISNVYQQNIAELFITLNQFLDNDLKIRYKKEVSN